MSTQSGKPGRHKSDKNFIAVADKLFAVLEYFIVNSAQQQAVAFDTLTKSLPYARTTLFRVVYSLEKLGYLEKADERGCYLLANKFVELTQPVVNFRRLKLVARSVMQHLIVRFNETVNLGVISDGQVAYVDVLESPNALRFSAIPGERVPAHCTALGKAILAFLPEKEVATILRQHPLIRRTNNTITHRRDLMEHLNAVREHRLAVDLEENLAGVCCVAAPIFDQHGRVIGALSVSGPTSRMQAKLSRLRADVKDSGVAICNMLSPESSV
jgi:IclR family transcriptional regulator, KDG regulon repressor